MPVEPVKFLDEEDLVNLEKYEYHGGEYSYLDNILNPFWLKVAYAFPDWYAPNLITLTGFIINVVAALLIAFYDPMLIGEAPRWVYLNAAICLQIYATLDAADGKQARRLHASSPLGQIFDHGCDAINLIFIIISCCSSVGLRLGKTTTFVVICMCGAFACAQLIEYQSNVLLAGSKYFGVTETMLFCSVMMVITSLFGTELQSTDLVPYAPFLKIFKDHVELKYLCSLLLCTIVIVTTVTFLIQNAIKESPIPMEKRGNKNLDRASYFIRYIPVVIIGLCGYRLMSSHIVEEHPLYIIFLVGLTFSFLSIRINVSHLCRRKLTYKFAGMWPLVCITLNDMFGLVRNSVLVPICFCLFMVIYTSFIVLTINQIKEHLHIHAFHVEHKTE